MRVTRYLWISNLPARVTEQDIRDVLQSHGKIQSVRIHEHEGSNGAVVAFVDTKSATRAVESIVRLKKVNLSLQYCESSGIPGTNNSDQITAPSDYTQTTNTSLLQSDVNYSQQKSRSVSTVSDSSSVFHDPENNEQSDTCLSHTITNRNYTIDSKTTNMNVSPRFQNEHRGLKISHLPLRSSDTNLREGLFHEYKKHGKITSVFVRGQDEERICIITFKKSEDAEKALASSKGKVFFGTQISVQPHEGLNSEDPDLCPPEHALDEYHPKATKTLFVGNLCSGTITQDELRRTFRGYGEIIEIDIKIQANQPGASYAFIQYGDIKSVVRALKEQETIRVSGRPVKLGFGKSQPTNVVWLDNLSPTINEAFLSRQFGRYGQLSHVVLDRKSMRALLYFDNVEVAQHAVNETRNRALVGRKVQIDYAGYECQVAFMKKLAKHGSFGQVYENYKERLQEVLSLLPYGSVIPYLGDRQRYFVDSQREHFSSGNTKFSYRRSNCLRSSPVDHSSKYEQSLSRAKCAPSVSPHNRSHQSSDRRRTFITSSPDDSKISGNWICSHGNRNSHPGKSDAKIAQNEDRSSIMSHRRHQHNETSIKSKSLRYLSHAEVKSDISSRTHVDHLSLRGRGQLLEETDDISSGSFSSGFTNDDSFFETSSLKHSNGSSEYSAPTSKLLSHVLNNDKRRNVDSDASQKSSRINRCEVEPLDECSYSSNKKHTLKTGDSMSPQTRVASTRLSVGRSRMTSSQHNVHSVTDRNPDRRQSGQECPGENNNQKHNKTGFHSQGRALLRPPDPDYSSPNYSVKPKRGMLSKVASIYKDVEHSRQANISTISPISPDDAAYNKSEGAYECASSSMCSNIPSAVKSHDALTKLEMERAKLLRELSLLNNEVIGGSRGKTGNITLNKDNPNRKRTPSSSFFNDLPSTKLKCVENSYKCESVSVQSPTFTNDNLTSPEFRKSTSCAHSTRLMSTSHDSKCELSSSKQGVYNLPTDCHSNITDVASPTRRKFLQAHDLRNIHSNPRLETVFSTAVTSTATTSVLNISAGRQPILMTSSPRMAIAPEPTSPLIHISPPSSPMIMDKLSYTSTPSTSLSSSVLSASNSGSIVSSHANSCSRDPRLTLHHTQPYNDVPPPPPEIFKLPLWVDTSPHTEIMVSNLVTNSVMKTQSPGFTKSLCNVEPDIFVQDSSGCSLDERIRLLDVQLLKSEKARPTVDYSKFRIRRKTEANSTPQSTEIISTSQCITGVSVISCSPHSPIITTSTCSITTRSELAVTDIVGSSLSVSCSSTSISSTSPILSNSTPLNLVKPADTSEFVKSMLSFSKPSPSTPCDISNNPLSNDISTTTRHATLVPLSQSSFLTRLPRSCVSNSLSTANSIQSSVSFCSKQKSANNNNVHFNVCNVEHSSLSGAHPVGVATRMPSVKMYCGSDASKPENNDLVEKGDIKSNMTRDIFDYVEKLEPVVLSHSLTVNSAEYNTSVSQITDDQKCSDVSSKAGVHGVSPLLGLSNGFPIKSSQKQLTYPSISCLKSSPRDDSINSNKCKPTPLLNIPLTNTKKTQKLDSTRPILDDFVFQNSLGGNASKTSRLKKPQLKTSSSSLPAKHKPSATSQSKEIISTSTANKVVLRNMSVAKSKTSQKVSRKSTSKKLESTSESSLQKDSLPNNKSQLTVDSNRSTSSANNYSLLCSEKKPASPHSKKRKNVRDIKKKVIGSEDSDWEPNTITSSQPPSSDLPDPDSSTESHYESMYDKIKRRANQSVTKPVNSVMKRDALQRLLKNKGRELKKPYSNKSLVDSDTDECLSNDSSIHSDDTSNTLTKHSTKPNSSSNEVMSKPIKRKILTTSGTKSNTGSSLSPKRKRIVADSEASTLKESSRKTRGRKAKKSNVSSKPRSLNTQVRRNYKGVEQQESVTTLNRRSVTRRKKPCIQEENVTMRGNESKIVSDSIDSTVQLKTHKEKTILSVNKQCPTVKRTHRSLVHRVFASTDSSSLSSMISESSDDDLSSNQISALSVREKIDETDIIEVSNCQSTKTKSPTLQLSRSCSPEDLRADAAIRHTFGAFTAPFICLKTDPSHCSAIKHNPPQNTDVNTKFSPNSEDSKPTPPTLPMTDSSFSGDQQSNGVPATKLQTRDHRDWNIFSSLAKQSTPIKDDIMRQHLSSTSGLAAESDELPVNRIADASYDTEDELPSLEKHDDDDEVSFPCESSILLHESDGPNNHVGSLNTYNDDDLPPPVVSGVGNQLNFSSLPLAVGTVPDIIEEVIYDGLEVTIQDETHPTTNTSIKSDSCGNSPIIDKSVADVLHNVIEPTSKNPFMDITSHVDPESIANTFPLNVKSSVSVPIITSSLNTVSAQSIVFTSVPMLHVTTQSSEVPIVSKSMLVTISTTTPTNLSLSNCVLRADREVSVSQSYSSVSFSLNPLPQNHIAVILPTTTVSFPLTSFVTMSSPMSESSTNVTPSTSAIKLSSPLSVTCSSTTTQNSVSFTDCQQSQSVTSHLPTTGITTPIRITTSLDSNTPTSHVCLSSVSQTGNAVFDASDFTSYVQRVIERVKQEKDEETLQQREKTVNAGVHSLCTVSINKGFSDPIISINQSSSVLTPMHVLTFVAAGAATSTSQHKSTSVAISPNIPTQSLTNLSTSTHHLPSASNPSSSSLDNVSSVTPLTAYAPIPNRSDSLPTDSTNTQIGEFAARLANNPFTTYFYSLLTQKQLSPSLSPSIASGDTICQHPTDNPSLPLCSSSTLKNLSIPNASVSGDTADYLAAATMAAMAAMAGPAQDMTSFSQTVASASYSDSKSISTDNQLLQLWSAAHLGIQEYSIIWRGRLSLKNEEVFVNMHYVSGNQDLLKICMSVIGEQQVALTNIATSSSSLGSCMTTDAIGSTHQPLKIVQRMRLEASQLEGVQRKLRQLNDFCMCLTLAAAPPQTPDASLTNEQIRMNKILCDGFIKYMLEKCAAGIINVCHPCSQQNMYVIHIFPPCEFSRCQLQGYAPALYHSLEENPIPHVLTVITTV
ncbi:hypothetical protein MN116_003046 [Schistosoma mekongi]|uniref:Msx2-interacting protein n=1 Tax=Schistosoma mekongi TaxID=38744 RepID=A0AAE1ZGQ0_SCHME|nr:hypothetical protein MN116_003046 [Schistosoma mekongi]